MSNLLRKTGLISTAVMVMALGACTQNEPAESEGPEYPVIEEVFFTPRKEVDNVDTPSVWHGQNGEHWILSTAKATDVIIVNDAVNGEELARFGGTGEQAGQLRRPNSVVAVDNYAIIVERDNHRVQVIGLPGFESLGVFGASDLEKPYGLAVVRHKQDHYTLYVTDNYETVDGQIPPLSELGRRVHQFSLMVAEEGLVTGHVRAFGETDGEGVLYKVESIFADTLYNRLMVAEELETDMSIKIYDLEGNFTGEVLGRDIFKYEPEGVVLYACDDGSGYWIMTDQGKEANIFHVFDRADLGHMGAFTAKETMNTDGITLTQRAFGPFSEGAFFPVHDDGNVSALQWSDIAATLSLDRNCTIR